MIEKRKLALCVLLGLMGCGLAHATPVQAETSITSTDDLTTTANAQVMGRSSYAVCAPAQAADKLTINLATFTPARPSQTALFGSYTDTAAESVTGKNITISGTGTTQTLAYIAGAYGDAGTLGAYTEGSTAPSNTVTVTGGSASELAAAMSNTGTVTNNQLNLSDAVQFARAYGGYSQTGNATYNVLHMNGVKKVGSALEFTLYGGKSNSNTGVASHNTVEVWDSTGGDIFGGRSANDGKIEHGARSDDNTVIVHNSNFRYIHGGYEGYTADRNTVQIEDSTISNVHTAYIQGGTSASHNQTTITNSTVSGEIVGGWVYSSNYGNAADSKADENTITLTDVTLNDSNLGLIAGMNSTDGEANGNTVHLTSGTLTQFKQLYAGFSSGPANNNHLIIDQGAEISNVSYNTASGRGTTEAKGNTVQIDGTLGEGMNLMAGSAEAPKGIINGNIFTVGKTGRVYSGDIIASASATGQGGEANENVMTIEGYVGEGSLVVGAWNYGGDNIGDNNTVNISGTLDAGVLVCGSSDSVYAYYYGPLNVEANENTINLQKGANLGVGTVFYGDQGTVADGNTVNIEDGVTFAAGDSASDDIDIVAGVGRTEANDNTINLLGTVSASGLHLSGGLFGQEYDSGTYIVNGVSGTNNTLNVYTLNNNVKEITAFQNLNFYIPKEAVNGSTMLTITGGAPTDLTGATIKAGASDATILNVGDKINLIVNEAGVTTDEDQSSTTATKYGILTDAGFAQTGVEVKKDGENKIIATITKVAPKPPEPEPEPEPEPKPEPKPEPEPNPKPEPAATLNPGTKTIVEGKISGLAQLKNNIQFVATDAVQSAISAAQANASENTGDTGGSTSTAGMKWNSDAMARFTPYAVIGGESLKHDTGSYVRSHGFNANFGVVRRLERQDYIDTIMPFIEYGKSNYSTFLDTGARGDGEHQYLGGGILVRRDRNDGLYYETSLHGGRIRGDYTGVIDGTLASYNSNSSYMAMHAGIGKILPLQKNTSLDAYAKIFWTHEGSDTVTLRSSRGPAQYHFDSMDSVATRLGARLNRTIRKHQKVYIGTGWEYEFNGDGIASYNGLRTQSPSLQGSSGFLEAGWTKESTKESPYSLDLHLTGWTGLQQGITFAARFNYQF